MPANWPRCTAVQIPLPAYSANTAGWLLAASRSAWNWVTTMYRSCPTSSSVADRRSDVRSNMAPRRVALGMFMVMLRVSWGSGRRVEGVDQSMPVATTDQPAVDGERRQEGQRQRHDQAAPEQR